MENRNDDIPAITESDNKVSKTFIPTFPQSIVVSKKFESFRIFNTYSAPLEEELSASISSRNRVKLKKAKFKPEKIADCVIQKNIPDQT